MDGDGDIMIRHRGGDQGGSRWSEANAPCNEGRFRTHQRRHDSLALMDIFMDLSIPGFGFGNHGTFCRDQ